MAQDSAYTTSQDRFILSNAGKLTWREIGNTLGRNRHMVRGRWVYLKEQLAKGEPRTLPKGAKIAERVRTVENEGDSKQAISSTDDRIKTVDDLIEACKIDLKVWRVAKSTQTAHEGFYRDTSAPIDHENPHKKGWRRTHKMVTMYAVKVWLERRPEANVASQNLREQLVADMVAAAPKFPKIVRPSTRSTGRMMAEVAIFDPHFGKLAWGKETGENFDLKICSNDYLEAGNGLLGKIATYPVDEILIPIGNDMLHVDNNANTTTGGTKQDTDSRRQMAFLYAKRAAIQLIENALQIAPVRVVVVPGNHDRESMFFLGDSIESYFHHCNEVKVDNGPSLRKYVEYGNNLLGFTHGSEEGNKRLNHLMQVEQKQAWARCSHYEWHVGHLHIKRKRETFIVDTDTVDTMDGNIIKRWLPSLCATDAWHAMVGYVGGPRSAEAYLWDHKHGYGGHLPWNIDITSRR